MRQSRGGYYIRYIVTSGVSRMRITKYSMKFIEELERKSCGPLYDKPQFTVAIAEHVFSKLTLTRSYTVDKTCTLQDFVSGTCKCGCNTDIKHKFEDTSAGCSAVWHGSLDAIVGHAGDRVPLLISGNREFDEEYKYLTVDKHLNYHTIKHQLVAQAVVFSFLKQKNYPDSKISLVPVIGVSAKEVIFFLYDCKEDVLLQSVKMSLRCGKAVRYQTVIAIWLVLNYNYLGSGLGNIRNVHKCNFSSRARDVLEVYRSELVLGGVKESYEEDTLYPDDIPKEKICWPNKKPKFDF
ncbi:uncharacterized protein [Argopecten irradians]|uniref:uncharacterized protein isoform X2 n=1 Tax=Argopecten irradians TaxID=31199 RepID=UPI003721278D